jgi:ATP-dependent Clp protease ATP-binding subunit ClpA
MCKLSFTLLGYNGDKVTIYCTAFVIITTSNIGSKTLFSPVTNNITTNCLFFGMKQQRFCSAPKLTQALPEVQKLVEKTVNVNTS